TTIRLPWTYPSRVDADRFRHVIAVPISKVGWKNQTVCHALSKVSRHANSQALMRDIGPGSREKKALRADDDPSLKCWDKNWVRPANRRAPWRASCGIWIASWWQRTPIAN